MANFIQSCFRVTERIITIVVERPHQTKLIEAAVKGATYAGKFSLKGKVFECTKIKV